MDPKTRKQLEAAGWASGDATDFLTLTEAEAEALEMKLALAKKDRSKGGAL